MDLPVTLRGIGVVRSSHTARETTPIQAALSRAEHGTVVVDDAYRDGLEGLADFDYAWLLTWLHRSPGPPGELPALRQVPFLLRREGRKLGIFATRGPRRVNSIGLSLIRIVSVDGNEIRFAGVDLLNGTPVVDIKPYVSRFDQPPGQPRCGWFDQVVITDGLTPDLLGRDGSAQRPDQSG